MSPRQRKISQADLYHITCRGVAKRILFECNDDRRFLGRLMRELLDEHDVELYAWCFMSNHMHMLLHADLEITSVFMRKLLSAYARYFNDKYDRVGHLFQDRFGSVAVATDAQLMAWVDLQMDETKLYTDTNLTLKTMARALGLTQKRLAGLFKDHPKYNSLGEYINEKRFLYACQLLREEPNWTIEAVGAEAGFGGRRTFQTEVKRRLGITPSQYRQSQSLQKKV